jgi:hypothetical protein
MITYNKITTANRNRRMIAQEPTVSKDCFTCDQMNRNCRMISKEIMINIQLCF